LLSNLEQSKQFSAEEIQQSRLAFCNMNKNEKLKWLLNWVNNSWNTHSNQPNYNWNGIHICRTIWMDIYRITAWKLNHAIQAYNRGQKIPKQHSLIATRHPSTRTSISMGWVSSYLDQFCHFGKMYQLPPGKSFYKVSMLKCRSNWKNLALKLFYHPILVGWLNFIANF